MNRNHSIDVMVSREEKDKLKKNAEENGMSYSEYVRYILFSSKPSLTSDIEIIKNQINEINKKLTK